MLNLFSMLLRPQGHSQLKDEISELKSELANSNNNIAKLKEQLIVSQHNISRLNVKVKELNGVNEILLTVQQHIIEELSGSPIQSKKVVPLFSFGGLDDDDLPN